MASLSMNKLPWWGQLLLFAVVGALIVGGYFYQVEWPRREQMKVREAELQAIRARIAQGQETARKLPEFRAQVGDLEARLEGLRPILPEEKDVADLLRRIQTMAAQSNLTIRQFKPQAITLREMHAEWPISLELEGTYHNVGLFLDRVSKFPRIINVGGIVMTPPAQRSALTTVRVTCTAMTFVLSERPAAPAGAVAPKKAS